jgi:hypothetical protein
MPEHISAANEMFWNDLPVAKFSRSLPQGVAAFPKGSLNSPIFTALKLGVLLLSG